MVVLTVCAHFQIHILLKPSSIPKELKINEIHFCVNFFQNRILRWYIVEIILTIKHFNTPKQRHKDLFPPFPKKY